MGKICTQITIDGVGNSLYVEADFATLKYDTLKNMDVEIVEEFITLMFRENCKNAINEIKRELVL